GRRRVGGAGWGDRGGAAPIGSVSGARGLRAGQATCGMGSTPACAIREAAASALIWARALAPSVRLTASARPLSGSALRRRSSGSNETGGGGPGGMGKRGARNGRSGGAEGGGVGGGTRWVCLVVVVGRC